MKTKINFRIICLLMTITMLGTTVSWADTSGRTTPSVPAKPKNVKVVKKSSSSLKVSWSKVKGVSGYVVYAKVPGKKKYKKIKTLKSWKKNKLTHKKLRKNKTYKYKVRAFVKKKGKKKYSSYSYVVSARTTTKKSKFTNVKKVDVDFTNRYMGLNKISYVSTYLYGNKGKKYVSKKLRWTSSNPSIVKVRKGGYIQAMGKAGKTKIYIIAHNGVTKVLNIKVADYAKPSTFANMDKVKKMNPKFAKLITKYKGSMCRVAAYLERYKISCDFSEHNGDLVLGGQNLNITPIEDDLKLLVIDAKMNIWFSEGNVDFDAPGYNPPSVSYSDFNGKGKFNPKYVVRMATGWLCVNGNVD